MAITVEIADEPVEEKSTLIPQRIIDEFVPAVQALIDAGPGKIQNVNGFKDEDAAKAFLTNYQTAARYLNKSARKKYLRVAEDGKTWTLGVKVGDPIKRPRGKKDSE